MSDWIPTSDEVPPLNLPVWLFEPGRGIWVGERFDFEGGDNWTWANTYGSQCFQPDGTWYAPSNEIDLDYRPTHWMRLPEPPPAEFAHGDQRCTGILTHAKPAA